jgi:hypothetical protein
MKSLKFVAVLIGLSVATSASAVQVSNSTSFDTIRQQEATQSQLISQGQANALTNFLVKNTPAIQQSEAFPVFFEAVKKYNQGTATFLKISNSQRIDFQKSVVYLQNELAKINTEEARMWEVKIQKTSNIFGYLWSFDVTAFVSTQAYTIEDQEESATSL